MASRPRTLANTLKAAAAPAITLLVIANFAGYAIAGPNGLLAWGDYAQQREVKQVQLAALVEERDRIANRVELLSPEGVDPDLAEELVRRNTGQIRDDEHILPLD